MDAPKVTQENVGDFMVYAKRYRKKVLTRAVDMNGPFEVETREGTLTCPDGFLAVDAHGWPYPIARDEFEAIYAPEDSTP